MSSRSICYGNLRAERSVGDHGETVILRYQGTANGVAKEVMESFDATDLAGWVTRMITILDLSNAPEAYVQMRRTRERSAAG